MKILRLSVLCGLVVAAANMIGCGGGGSGTGGDGGGTAGGSTDLKVAYQINGFNGTLVGNLSASSTPRTVQVNVSGTVRSISNVVVVSDCADGDPVGVMSEGSQLLKMDIPNPGLGVSFGGSSIHAPITATGVLTASILEFGAVNCKTPPGSLQGHALPNGLSITFENTSGADVKAGMDGVIKLPTSVGSKSGNATVTYLSPSNESGIALELNGTGFTGSVNGGAAVHRLPSASGSLTVPWSVSTTNATGIGDISSANLTVAFYN